ncbi:MAG: SCO family protein [Chitinophagia bacterium]|nr:SCO family protein [Chitinophagia bacterium]
MKGKILVLNFIFTHCTTSCPNLSKSMQVLQKGFRRDPKKESTLEDAVQFLSITVDPERDSFPALRAYADRYGANPDHWWFLTGNKKDIYTFIRGELQLAAGPGDGGADDLIHTEKLVLVDQDRFVRGYYDGLNEISVRKCADDIVLLTLEKKKKK